MGGDLNLGHEPHAELEAQGGRPHTLSCGTGCLLTAVPLPDPCFSVSSLRLKDARSLVITVPGIPNPLRTDPQVVVEENELQPTVVVFQHFRGPKGP